MRNEWSDRPRLWRLLSGKDTDWSAVISRLDKKPDEARWQRTQHGRSGRLFLHYVLEYLSPPLDVIEKLIEVHPKALQHRNNYGSLPLHEAVNVEHGNSVEVVRAVFEAYPEAMLEKNVSGCLPIHYVLNWGPFAHSPSRARKLLSDRNVHVMKVLIEKLFIGMIIQSSNDDNNNNNNARVHQNERNNEIDNENNSNDSTSSTSNFNSNNNISDEVMVIRVEELDAPWLLVCTLWDRNDLEECEENLQMLTDLLLQARYKARHFHAASVLSSSSTSVATSSSSSSSSSSSTLIAPVYQPLHAVLQEENKPFRIQKFRDHFIKRYGEQAAQRDFRGRLCFNYAIERGYTWDCELKALYDLAAKVLETRDELTHLYPFMAAAVGEHSDLTTIVELLRQTPSVVTNFLIRAENSLHENDEENKRTKKRRKHS